PAKLDQNLAGVAFEEAGTSGRRIGTDRQRRSREHASEKRADRPTDAVHTEHVKRIIIAERLLESGAGPEADRARRNADHDAVPRQPKTGGGGERAGARDGA